MNNNKITSTQVALPKGGGAIQGIGETFQPNEFTGTAALSIPIPTSPCRGFEPHLSLDYSSASGNGSFGLGFSLSIPNISRKTTKGLPRYDGDTFILSGAEDLVPVIDDHTPTNSQFEITAYRPRTEGLFARIEQWLDKDNGLSHWRVVSKENITSIYGVTPEATIADPQNPTHIFQWLLQETFDAKGNHILYQYKSEGLQSNSATLYEVNRNQTANKYIERIKYGNDQPIASGADLKQALWHFEVVFDYGEYNIDSSNPSPYTPVNAWQERADPFSTYHAAFEIRTHRLCRTILLFHRFKELDTDMVPVLVHATHLQYAETVTVTQLKAVESVGYRKDATNNTYVTKGLPPLTFSYTLFDPAGHSFVPFLTAEGQFFPGLVGANYMLIDLYGEGVPGVLYSDGATVLYSEPQSNQNPKAQTASTVGYAPFRAPRTFPIVRDFANPNHRLMDLTGDGQLDLVVTSSAGTGYYTANPDASWQNFRMLPVCPSDFQDPDNQLLDVTGDGLTDILRIEHDRVLLYPGQGQDGFGAPQTRLREPGLPWHEQDAQEIVVRFADMFGNGGQHLVRIISGRVECWPHLGYGRFGQPVLLANAPRFADGLDTARLFLADLDGSGTADLIYLYADRVAVWFNQSGNAFSAEPLTIPLPSQWDHLDQISFADVLGNGTTCLIFSENHPEPRHWYYDFSQGQKPYLLTAIDNNLGAQSSITYASSTQFYLADKAAGKPWLTNLPFPVQVVAKIAAKDLISNTTLVSTYAYHHGYYDGVEREFRGFGRVDRCDAETFWALAQSNRAGVGDNAEYTAYVPPVLTRTWYHTGIYFGREHVSNFFAGLGGDQNSGEYFREPGLTAAQAQQLLLEDTLLPAGLTGEEEREACRALKGSMLRQEIYALDGTSKENFPYTVLEQNFTIVSLQPKTHNQYGVFFTHAREAISYHYERNPADPRISHTLTLAVDGYGNVLKSLAIGYGRRTAAADPTLTDDDKARQSQLLLTYTENVFTKAVQTADAYHTPLLAETRTYELTGFTPENNAERFSFDEWTRNDFALLSNSQEISYEQMADNTSTQKRRIEHVRTCYRPDDLGASQQNDPLALLPLGVLEPLALAGETYNLAFTPGLLDQVYLRDGQKLLPVHLADILAGGGADRGGYVDLDGNGHWWTLTGRIFLSPKSGDTAEQEMAYAQQHFFLPHRTRDPFHTDAISTESFVTYDAYDLLVEENGDTLGNVVKSDNDYRVLRPKLVTDPNRNRTAVAFDALGMVVATAVMGKEGETIGDLLEEFNADPALTDLQAFIADPESGAASLLGKATTRIVYDLDRYPRAGQPPFAATLARETHIGDLLPSQGSQIQVNFTYSDGFGRVVQSKMQAEPGDAPVRAANIMLPSGDVSPGALTLDNGVPVSSAANPRWVGTGRTVFNNKGKPIKQYEPFFSSTHLYEPELEMTDTGVTSVLFYDPVERVVATLHPNHTFEKVVFDPWRQESWDVNDTVTVSDPNTDPDVGAYFVLLPTANYLPTWYDQRRNGQIGADEKTAADKAAAHAATPSLTYFDVLGRSMLTIADNGKDASGVDQKYAERVKLDIKGNQRDLIDANGRVAMRYAYDMLSNRIYTASMDAGERWVLTDVADKPLYHWDSKNRQFRSEYDPLRRPTGSFLREGAAAEQRLGYTVYGEQQATPEHNNLRGKIFQSVEQAGVFTNDEYDFKGNLLRSHHQLTSVYWQTLDWSSTPPPALEEPVYASRTRFDALNRPIQLIAPHSDQPGTKFNIIQPIYNAANRPAQVHAWLNQAAEPANWLDPNTANLHAVTNIDYDAKGQRTLIAYGNGVHTTYTYDSLTFHLVHLQTMQAGTPLQDLSYTYDPVGNITHIQDDAQQTVFFKGQVVPPQCDYVYDAIYRLIEATGREQIGQVGMPPQTTWNDEFRVNQPNPNDGQAMRRYTEQYRYDAVGNFEALIHQATAGNWTRTYSYTEASLIEAGKQSNRLSNTTVGPMSEPYTYDAHGNMTGMPHLSLVSWDCSDQLRVTAQQVVNDGIPERTWYVYDARGQRVRQVTVSRATTDQTPVRKKERLYLGGCEIYREFEPDGAAVKLERETLHIMDDQQRVALVETRTIDTVGNDPAPAQLIRYQFGNHLGSVSLELDEQAQIISYEEYTPFGSTAYQAVRSQTETPKRYRYSGKERDDATGFYYYGTRYYAPWLGHWTSPDPKGVIDGLNLYAFVRGNPATFLDPTGTCSSSNQSLREQSPSLDSKLNAPPVRDPELLGSMKTAVSSSAGTIQNSKFSALTSLVGNMLLNLARILNQSERQSHLLSQHNEEQSKFINSSNVVGSERLKDQFEEKKENIKNEAQKEAGVAGWETVKDFVSAAESKDVLPPRMARKASILEKGAVAIDAIVELRKMDDAQNDFQLAKQNAKQFSGTPEDFSKIYAQIPHEEVKRNTQMWQSGLAIASLAINGAPMSQQAKFVAQVGLFSIDAMVLVDRSKYPAYQSNDEENRYLTR